MLSKALLAPVLFLLSMGSPAQALNLPPQACGWLLAALGHSVSILPGPKVVPPTGTSNIDEMRASVLSAFIQPLGDLTPAQHVEVTMKALSAGNPLQLTKDEIDKIETTSGMTPAQKTVFESKLGTKPYGITLPEKPALLHTTYKPETWAEGIKNLENIDNPVHVLENFLPLIDDLPVMQSLKTKIKGLVEKVGDILLEDTDSTYQNGSIAGSNEVLINYIRRELERDPVYLNDALKFYFDLKVHDLKNNAATLQKVADAWDSTDFDVWSMALKDCEGDTRRAIRVLGVYGHDEMSNQLPLVENSKLNGLIMVLNSLEPLAGSDLYQPGSIPNTLVKPKIARQIKDYKDEFKKLYGYDNSAGEAYRAGQYHLIASAFVTGELVSAGFGKALGLKLPIFVNETLGIIYKFIVLAQYAGPDAMVLYKAGYEIPEKSVGKPDGWDDARYAKARLAMDKEWSLLKLTIWDHYFGSKWAYKVLKGPPQEDLISSIPTPMY